MDKQTHLRLIGATGRGRSKILERMICENIDAGEGVCLIDPHGDLSDTILKYLEKRGLEDRIVKADGNNKP